MHVRQVGVDKIRLRGKLRVTLPLFDELPCVAGIQASALPLPISTLHSRELFLLPSLPTV